jgi:hypothetical protein
MSDQSNFLLWSMIPALALFLFVKAGLLSQVGSQKLSVIRSFATTFVATATTLQWLLQLKPIQENLSSKTFMGISAGLVTLECLIFLGYVVWRRHRWERYFRGRVGLFTIPFLGASLLVFAWQLSELQMHLSICVLIMAMDIDKVISASLEALNLRQALERKVLSQEAQLRLLEMRAAVAPSPEFDQPISNKRSNHYLDEKAFFPKAG